MDEDYGLGPDDIDESDIDYEYDEEAAQEAFEEYSDETEYPLDEDEIDEDVIFDESFGDDETEEMPITITTPIANATTGEELTEAIADVFEYFYVTLPTDEHGHAPIVISEEEFNNLTEEEKNSGIIFFVG